MQILENNKRIKRCNNVENFQNNTNESNIFTIKYINQTKCMYLSFTLSNVGI